ncbi:gastrula zinc finger protein XlCGF57.1-like [Cheilinus undulatus]|uniref:gastrula zinc finger protein XlCGF57.1-like n=1 Tax=Cheilinus undulatus TaxID=241271 RepID=UPI001BD3AD15|nr:gastrula zinc finger protein XlCGF57.1-like [Cheilinus undulatus]
MSKVQMLRSVVNQRLTAAAEEIFDLFERTIAEYEEQLHRSKENQHKLQDAVYNPEVRLHRSEVQQVSLAGREAPSLNLEDLPEPALIKEEQEELWTHKEGQQLQGSKGADIIKFTFTPDAVKSEEEDGEKSHSSQLYEHLSEEKRDMEHLKQNSNLDSVTHSDTLHSESETDDSSCDWEETSEPLLNKDGPVDDQECETGNTSVSSGCGTSINQKELLQNPTGLQTGSKPFSCSFCGKRYPQKISLAKHMKRHSEGTCFSCSVCKKSFPWRGELVRHMRIHTGEKPFSCSACGISFSQRTHLTSHLRVHTGEKPFTCTVCKMSFSIRKNLGIHMRTHTGQKPFSCSVCSQLFARREGLTRHSIVHTGEKAFNCSFCGKRFAHLVTLKRHLTVHTGEKAFQCNVCEKRFARLQYLKKHKCIVGSMNK